jgi:hypothetical protein
MIKTFRKGRVFFVWRRGYGEVLPVWKEGWFGELGDEVIFLQLIKLPERA